ncbi:MAG: hypothetical protein LAT76_02365, partial [Schleiferiaceae bacterium]|nr:hypothetical protein [Schleiferiaceae bacterium]
MRKRFYQALRRGAWALVGGVTLLGSSWASAQSLPELMYFKFDGTGNSVLNEAANPVAPSGTLSGTMTQGGTAQFNGGLVGDGQLSNSGNFNTGWTTSLSGSWTVSVYIQNIMNVNTNTSVNIFGSTSHTGQSIRMYTNGFGLNTLSFAMPNNQGFSPVGIPVSIGATLTVHVVHDATAQTITIYRNGVFETSVPAPSNLTVNAPAGSQLLVGGHIQSATVGRNINTGTLIDEFRLYDRALSASEIALTWNRELPVLSDCDIPDNLQVTAAGVEAVFDWVPGTTNSGYVLEYGPANFTPGNGTVVTGTLPANAPPVTITGLSPLTAYDYYLAEICNSNSDTSIVLSGSFTTLVACPVPTQFAFNPPSGSEISFSWNSLGSSFEIEYGIGGFAQGTGTIQAATGLADTIS